MSQAQSCQYCQTRLAGEQTRFCSSACAGKQRKRQGRRKTGMAGLSPKQREILALYLERKT